MNSCILLIVRIKVDLPQPDGPISAVTVPAPKFKLMSESTWCFPNQACTPRVSSPVPSEALPGDFTLAAATSASDDGRTPASIFFSLSGVFITWSFS